LETPIEVNLDGCNASSQNEAYWKFVEGHANPDHLNDLNVETVRAYDIVKHYQAIFIP